MRLVLLRHGRTEWNAQRRFQGQADPPLDDVGRMQAYEVAGLVAALQPDRIVSSDLARALETARIVASAIGLPVAVDERLRERSLGHWEGLTRDEVERDHPDEFEDWRAGRDVSRRGGETRDQVAARALAAFADQPAAETLVFVTHSATAMALCNALIGIAQAQHPLGPLANCHWTDLWRDEGSWRLRAHNIGVPGTVIPVAIARPSSGEDAPDADA
ncbi:MAG: histidine phosphatase family protein [Jatrophihabitans sp.]|uniref:histidine phosphatase family protein n=1 Tax=Jatrophihabitans sp. TaxID=1932789 RepID=UPI003F7DD589